MQSYEDFGKRSLILHEQLRGKIAVAPKAPVKNHRDLSVVYTPGVAEPCKVIAQRPEAARRLTIKSNTVAVVTDGSAVLGLGNIGPLASIPVMEGKALLFKKYADIDAWPIALDTQDTQEIIQAIRHIAPVFGGINLEDISAPRCFEIEEALQDLGIPVFHDDQHGTAIVVLAGLLNATPLAEKRLEDLKVVINGAGAAGIAIAKLLKCVGYPSNQCTPVKEIIVCDSKGIIHAERTDLTPVKRSLLAFTNPNNIKGTLREALEGADVFIGVSTGNLLTTEDIRRMAPRPIIFALANPIPEIMPEEARKGGAVVIGTGRSDLPNQVNNVLAFPGIFRGALDACAPAITPEMKLAAAHALARAVEHPTPTHILPDPLDRSVAPRVAKAVREAAQTRCP